MSHRPLSIFGVCVVFGSMTHLLYVSCINIQDVNIIIWGTLPTCNCGLEVMWQGQIVWPRSESWTKNGTVKSYGNNVTVLLKNSMCYTVYTHETHKYPIMEDLALFSDIPAGECILHAHSLWTVCVLAKWVFCTHQDMQESLLSERLWPWMWLMLWLFWLIWCGLVYTYLCAERGVFVFRSESPVLCLWGLGLYVYGFLGYLAFLRKQNCSLIACLLVYLPILSDQIFSQK